MINCSQNKKESGLSLIELIVSMGIVVMAFTAIFSLAISTTSSSARSKNELIATNLAREGLELVRHIRDSRWRVGENWLLMVDSNNDAQPDRIVEKNTNYIVNNPLIVNGSGVIHLLKSDDFTIYLEDISGALVYTHDSFNNTASGFSRKIIFQELEADKKVLVISRVSWPRKGGVGDYQVELQEYLYNWYEQ